jgi:hypothetical protein
MKDIASFSSSDVPPNELNAIAAEYLALERLRVFRQLLVPRCIVLAVVVGTAGILWPPGVPWWAGVVVCLVVPACVWIAEVVREHRLAVRLVNLPVQKVIKSS